MTVHQTLLPPGWTRPKGYANGIAASGRMVFTGGIVGWDAQERFTSDTLAGQFAQVIENTLAVLAQAGAGPEHIVRMTWYVTSRDDYLAQIAQIGAHYREAIGRNFPAMAVVEVVALVEKAALIEIETTAIIPD